MVPKSAMDTLCDWRTDLLIEDEVISIHHERVRYDMADWEQIDLISEAMLQSPHYDVNVEHRLTQPIEWEAWSSPAD